RQVTTYAWRQTTDHRIERRLIAAPGGRAFVNRQEQIVFGPPRVVRLHDADYRVRLVVDEDRFADEIRPRIERALPAARSKDDSIRSARIVGRKEAAGNRVTAQRREQVGGHRGYAQRHREIEPDGALL